MRLLLTGLILVLALPASAAPRESRRSVSVNGAFRVQLFEQAPGTCRLEVRTDDAVQWTVEACVGDTSDAYFVSQDGERVWVIHTLPLKADGKARYAGKGRLRRQVAPGWATTRVAVLYDREGKVLKAHRLSDFLKDGGYRKVRFLSQRFTWLEGVNGVPGKGPRLERDGTLAFETVDGVTHELELDPPQRSSKTSAQQNAQQ